MRHAGEQAFRRIRTDHRFCATCFRQLKEIERPPSSATCYVDPPAHAGRGHEAVRDCLVGFEYPTAAATTGVDEADSDDRWRRLEFTRLSCQCGAVDPADRHGVLQALDATATAASLWRCLVTLGDEGALDDPDRRRYFRALERHWGDWAFAAGRALTP